ncbi:unnamed protein product [Hermetia illucens]|uniref:Peptidase S1 domain-containing protein n=1 Tax=Hermetia illucens TaxID=343691 RepID=A0A7R8US81_HERIL|nr:unnamed protein product [Hermetia illucens]
MLRTKLKCLWLFLCLFLVTSHAENVTRNSVDPVRQQKTFDDDDTVVIEAAPLERKRIGRQIDFYQGSWAQALGEGSACLSSIGLLGSCMSFHNCYPYYKFPFLGLYDPFLGSYDQCTYVSGTGQQEFGICCTNQLGGVPTLPVEQPQVPEIPQVPVQLPTPQPVVDIGQPKPPIGVNVTDEQDSKLEPWPPQSPTHPPTVSTTTLQWPPPIPTHPPDHQAPTHPAFPSWPPQSPTHPPFAGHPSFPSYPTHPSFPTHPAAFPGHPSFPTHPPSIPPSHPSFPPSQSPIYPSFPGWPPTTPQRPPSTTRPPVSWPPTTKPPSWPPTTKPPSWPPTTKPPPSWPPTTKPPASWPPTTKPPPSWPPTTKPPPSRPPTTKPPVSRPPDSGFQAQCGAKNGVLDQERIVGGQSASPNEWPWIVVLFNNGRQFCGGSLLDNIHILTAAHCVAHMSSWDVARLKAHLGDHNIKSATEVQHVERAIKRVVRHRGFDSRTLVSFRNCNLYYKFRQDQKL